ncbi:MAG: tRNA-dihydrouridine synthase family protein [Deltaproteobacteria bacterium]|nr:MAG: tRNA-dihydrouridine synthase family protein [Deltaproteobacteria bacterium]
MPRIRLYMAPMKGLTDHLFRSAFADHFGGFDLAVAPFITTKQGHRIKRNYVKDVLPENNTRMPVIPQILSKTAGDFIILANYLYDLGYDTVNWNLGCPYPMVANKKRGSGMLPYTDRIQAFLDRVIPEINGSLSIKMRLGWKENIDIFKLLPVIDPYPLSQIIIHPRTGLQRYEGPVDLDAFEDCLAVTGHTVVYNGDIRTVDDFRRLYQRFDRVHAWMIGRWCIADPFLPGRITTGADIPDKIYRMQLFHDTLFEAYNRVLDGPSHVMNKMKGFWRYFSLPFEDCKKSMKNITKSRLPEQYLERVNLFFETEAKLRKPADIHAQRTRQ